MENAPALPDEVFLKGRIVTLRRPDVGRDVLQGDWHSWFNDQHITAFLEHGLRPVSREEEARIITDELQRPDALLLAITNTFSGALLGVISLKSINHVLRRAEIALVTSGAREPGAALEAMALLTAHGFNRLNLDKIYAGQHEGLWKWVNVLALIGYKIEGLRRSHGFRNGQSYDAVLTGVTAHDFRALENQRGGNVLGDDMSALLAMRSRRNMIEAARSLLADFNRQVCDC